MMKVLFDFITPSDASIILSSSSSLDRFKGNSLLFQVLSIKMPCLLTAVQTVTALTVLDGAWNNFAMHVLLIQ